ncbi:hypothetical protein [uncultured Corynebacterium sp.]|uniref:hypothetical protein n=1 Tax=uncultured Corynebacterium sp. TaxID=159447 RepID=UPI0025FE28EC|nr:hypothetical protein [uncultured Corynebacterium sp.]
MTNTAERGNSRDSSTEQGRVDRRVVKTQAAIHRALEDLVCEKPPHRINYPARKYSPENLLLALQLGG